MYFFPRLGLRLYQIGVNYENFGFGLRQMGQLHCMVP